MVETLYLSHMIAFGEDILGYFPPNTVVDGRQGIPIVCFWVNFRFYVFINKMRYI